MASFTDEQFAAFLNGFLDSIKMLANASRSEQRDHDILIEIKTILKQHMEQDSKDKRLLFDHVAESPVIREKANKAYDHVLMCENDKHCERLSTNSKDIEAIDERLDKLVKLIDTLTSRFLGWMIILSFILAAVLGEKGLSWLLKAV